MYSRNLAIAVSKFVGSGQAPVAASSLPSSHSGSSVVCIENQARELVGSRTLATPQSFCMSVRQRSDERSIMDLGGLSEV